MAENQLPEDVQSRGHSHGPEQPWEQQPRETAQAHQGFVTFRDMGSGRTVAGAARTLGRSAALLYRWSRRHKWFARAYAWDLACRREEEATLREARQEALQRQARDADRLQRLGMARLGGLVRRDPETGELTLDPEVTVQDAVRIYKLGLDIDRSLTATTAERAEDEGEDQDAELKRKSDAELRQIIELARQRAEEERGDAHEED